MKQRTRQIEQLIERGIPIRQIARAFDVSREWVDRVRHRYEARKYKELYQELLDKHKALMEAVSFTEGREKL